MNLRLTFPFATMLSGLFATPSFAATPTPGYVPYFSGDPTNITTETTPGLLLVGGGPDQDDAMQWMVDRSGHGDFVVLRASGADGYNDFLLQMGAHSVESFVISSRVGAEDPYVLNKLRHAEAIFFAGGDQSLYMDYFKGTKLAAIVSQKAKVVPVGGTSAGLAILGEWIFAAHFDSITSPDAMRDPFSRNVDLDRNLLDLPILTGIITDSHFGNRDRMGRLVSFLSRIIYDGWGPIGSHGLGVDEETALALTLSGTATLFGKGHAYMLTALQAPTFYGILRSLSMSGILVHRMAKGESFDVIKWGVVKHATESADYQLNVKAGILTSTQANGNVN